MLLKCVLCLFSMSIDLSVILQKPTVAPTKGHSEDTSLVTEHWTSSAPAVTQAPDNSKDFTHAHESSPRDMTFTGIQFFRIT